MLPNDYDVRMMQDNRRFSCDSPGPSNWTNGKRKTQVIVAYSCVGWTASTLLSDNVHPKLFGDALVSCIQSFFSVILTLFLA